MAQIGIEEELMLAYQRGDKQAGEKLYVLIKPALYTFLYRFNRDEQLSIDLVQDTFLPNARDLQTLLADHWAASPGVLLLASAAARQACLPHRQP